MKEIGFAERRSAAAAAKKQLIAKMNQAPKPDDPAVLEKRAERAALKSSNALLRSERARVKAAAQAQLAAESEARALAEATHAKALMEETSKRAIAQQAEQKAERDRRYAARKARNK